MTGTAVRAKCSMALGTGRAVYFRHVREPLVQVDGLERERYLRLMRKDHQASSSASSHPHQVQRSEAIDLLLFLFRNQFMLLADQELTGMQVEELFFVGANRPHVVL